MQYIHIRLFKMISLIVVIFIILFESVTMYTAEPLFELHARTDGRCLLNSGWQINRHLRGLVETSAYSNANKATWNHLKTTVVTFYFELFSVIAFSKTKPNYKRNVNLIIQLSFLDHARLFVMFVTAICFLQFPSKCIEFWLASYWG